MWSARGNQGCGQLYAHPSCRSTPSVSLPGFALIRHVSACGAYSSGPISTYTSAPRKSARARPDGLWPFPRICARGQAPAASRSCVRARLAGAEPCLNIICWFWPGAGTAQLTRTPPQCTCSALWLRSLETRKLSSLCQKIGLVSRRPNFVSLLHCVIDCATA